MNKYTKIIVVVISLVILNLAFNKFYKRFDLTSDKRYTLSEATINILNDRKVDPSLSCNLLFANMYIVKIQ